MQPGDCTDQELLGTVATLIGSHRELTAKLVAFLAEIEERRLHLVAGFPSMFDYCTKQLGMSEGEAFRRILAARLGRRFPVVYSLLASGAVHLSALELLREHLTEANHVELLNAASHKTKREVEMLLAARFPRPDASSRLRTARVEPLSADRFRLELTASRDLVEKLDLCRDLMRHTNPSGDLAVVIDRALDLLLANLQTKRLARAKRPRPRAPSTHAPSRRIPNAVRRDVFERDGLGCTYISPDGRRCGARAFLELDHVHAHALGGDHTAANLRVLCRAHNQLHAEQTFGRDAIEQQRHLRQQKCVSRVTSAKVLEALKTPRLSGPRSASRGLRLGSRSGRGIVGRTSASGRTQRARRGTSSSVTQQPRPRRSWASACPTNEPPPPLAKVPRAPHHGASVLTCPRSVNQRHEDVQSRGVSGRCGITRQGEMGPITVGGQCSRCLTSDSKGSSRARQSRMRWGFWRVSG